MNSLVAMMVTLLIATANAGYVVQENACSDELLIHSAEECEAAASELDITWNSCCQHNDDQPYGCYKRTDNDFIFNGNTETPRQFPCSVPGNCRYGMRWAVCKTPESVLTEVQLPLVPAYGAIVGYADILDDIHFEIDFTINAWPTTDWFFNVFQCGTNNIERFPGIFTPRNGNDGFHISVAGASGNGLMGGALELNVNYHVEIDFTQSSWTVVVNGETLRNAVSKSSHSVTRNMPCYSGFPYHRPADVTITALTMTSTSTPNPTPSPTTAEPTPSPTPSHWIAAGNPANDNWRDGIPNVECAEDSRVKASDSTVHGDDIGVSCCSVDGSNGVREFDGQCYQAVTYGDAERICEDNGLRLCSLSEMLGKATKGAGCSHDSRYNWVSDECGSESGHYAHQGRTDWIGWGFGQEDYYCQNDDNNVAKYWSTKSVKMAVGCCYEDVSSGTVKGARPDCNAHPSTFAEAEAVCADHDMRLCTLAELATGITEGMGCSYNGYYEWTSNSCDLFESSATGNAAASYSMHSEDANESVDDFVAIALGAAVGMAMVGVVVAVIVVMRRRKGMEKEEEVAMSEVVTAPKVQPTESMDGVEAMSESVTAPKVQPAEVIDGVETV